MLPEQLEALFQTERIELGVPEKVFAAAQNNPQTIQNKQAVLIENIDKKFIVSDDGFADLVFPKVELFIKHKLFSFLAIDENKPEHQEVLRQMIDLALQTNGSDNNSMFLNILKNKVTDKQTDHDVVMSVAYLHLWSVQTNAMKKTEEDFLKDGDNQSRLKISIEAFEQIQRVVKKFFPSILVNKTDQKKFAPVDIEIKNNAQADLANLFFVARVIIRYFENQTDLKILAEKGIRLFVRQIRGEWELHILTGGRLQPISKRAD